MDTYHEIKMQVKTQLKGHFLFLYGWLLFVSLLIALIQNVGGFLGNGLGATLLSLALSLLCVVVNNTMLFLFIQRVRSYVSANRISAILFLRPVNRLSLVYA